MIKTLIENCANINAADQDGMTPFHIDMKNTISSYGSFLLPYSNWFFFHCFVRVDNCKKQVIPWDFRYEWCSTSIAISFASCNSLTITFKSISLSTYIKAVPDNSFGFVTSHFFNSCLWFGVNLLNSNSCGCK